MEVFLGKRKRRLSIRRGRRNRRARNEVLGRSLLAGRCGGAHGGLLVGDKEEERKGSRGFARELMRGRRRPREAGARKWEARAWLFIAERCRLGFGPAGRFGARRGRSRPRRCVASSYRGLVSSLLTPGRLRGRGKRRWRSKSMEGAGCQRGVRHNVNTKAEREDDVAGGAGRPMAARA